MSRTLGVLVTGVRRWLRPAPLLALAVALLAVLPALAVAGLVATRAGGDSPFLLERVQQLATVLAAGNLPPRWMPDAAYGLGYPFWNYYGPLVYLYAAVVALLGGGVVGAIKVAQLACFLAAAAGMYRFGERTWGGAGAGLVASAAYTLAPYHLVNLYVRGDALAELAAYAVFPWLLIAVDTARLRRTPGAVVGLGLATAALLTSHNISALLFAGVVAIYLLWPRPPVAAPAGAAGAGAAVVDGSDGHVLADRALAPRLSWTAAADPVGTGGGGPLTRLAAGVMGALLAVERRLWRPWRRWRGRWVVAVAAGLLLGLALSAWFWAPALLEQGEVQLTENTTGYFSYDGHFRGLDAIDLQPVFDYTIDDQRAPWRMGLVQVLVALVGVLAAWRLPGGRRRLGLWLTVAGLATLMITPLSRPVWAAVPLLAFIQFPWRWLSVQAFGLALLAAPVGLGRPWRPLAVVVLLALAALPGLAFQTLGVDGATRADIEAFEVFSHNIGTTVRAEYLPRAVKPRPSSSVDVVTGRQGNPRPISGLAVATLIRRGAGTQEWQVEVSGDQAATVAFPTYWFPVWTATLQRLGGPARDLGASPSGEPVPTPAPGPAAAETVTRATGVVPGSGWISVEVPPGRYQVRLALARSDIRALAEGLSLVALLVAFALLLVNRRRDWRTLGVAVLAGLVASVLLARVLPVGADEGPVTLDTGRVAWPHRNPGGLYFGDAHLTGASLDQQAVEAGQEVAVDLHWAAAPEEYRLELALVSPAQPVYGVPDVRSTAAVSLVEGDDRVVLDVPTDITDGLYFVRLTVKDGTEELAAESRDGFTVRAALRRQQPRFRLGDVYLGPVRVRSTQGAAVSGAAPLARMGELSLRSLTTEQEDGRLRVDLTWEADRRQAVEYKTSVRLLDPDGDTIVQEDKLPLYGYYPTTAWEAARPWLDRRWLALPPGLAPGNAYAVEVVLYTEDPPAELESARVPGVSITSPAPAKTRRPAGSSRPVEGTD